MIRIEIACADNEDRPDRPNYGGVNDESNWKLVLEAETPIQALTLFVEAANDEEITIENNWLRVKEDGQDITA